MQLENTSAIVTGGASGLGAATARALAEKGARVFALDLKAAIDNAAGTGQDERSPTSPPTSPSPSRSGQPSSRPPPRVRCARW